MTHDVECPYCGAGQEINHDDGYGYSEDEKHQQECGDCDRTFVFTTSISYYYEAEKADCLNDSNHDYQPTKTCPKKYSRMQCTVCDEERPCTPEEMNKILNS